jgi:glycosyltransferase involved in cell wall biosynthesis
MRAFFVYFGPLDVNSAIQAFHFGNELTDQGWEVVLAGLGDTRRMAAVGEARFTVISHDEIGSTAGRLPRGDGETIVIAWTPRERVRRLVEPLAARLDAPYVVHLEDNERFLLESTLHMSLQELQRLPMREQDHITPIDVIHPSRHLDLLRGAAAVTVITEELNEFNVAGRPHHVARPGIDSERFEPDLEPPVNRRQLGLGADDFVLVYHGTVHYANQHEMLSLYLAVQLLRRQGRRVRLVRIGHTEFGGVDPLAFRAMGEGVIELGPVPWRHMPAYLALADAYVQPGAPDDFNRYRLPSKLPEFLAMGRPVILPHCNIGHDLEHGENALLLEEGNAIDIVGRVEELMADPQLAERLGRGARAFALEQLSWPANATALADFYRATMATPVADQLA